MQILPLCYVVLYMQKSGSLTCYKTAVPNMGIYRNSSRGCKTGSCNKRNEKYCTSLSGSIGHINNLALQDKFAKFLDKFVF